MEREKTFEWDDQPVSTYRYTAAFLIMPSKAGGGDGGGRINVNAVTPRGEGLTNHASRRVSGSFLLSALYKTLRMVGGGLTAR
ncbi:hypothetical protein HMI54_005177 [Coelomomyces lativittatus]|nr:hypothetical protein HMI54_005177 [Coelomomyces lativittatus]